VSEARGGAYRLGVLAGDGIGPEIVPAAVRVADVALAAAGGVRVEWVHLPVGAAAIGTHDTALPDSTMAALAGLDAWILGPHDSAAYPEPHRRALNPSAAIRKRFDLFANVRPARGMEGVPAVAPAADLVVVRENTQGFYADRSPAAGSGEYMPTHDVAIASAIFTRPAIERVARVAAHLARQRRGRLTIVHKANVLPLTTGMFRDVCREVATEEAGLEIDDLHVDAMAAALVRRPEDFDVIVAENMFGDILSDLAGELVGSLGIAPSLNASNDAAMAQAVHGAAPDIAGLGTANPVAIILSTAMLFDWLGARRADPALQRAAVAMRAGVAATMRSGPRTPDIGGSAGTAELTAAIVAAIERPSA
jgi:3-isopropylmalate dehydrogenase